MFFGAVTRTRCKIYYFSYLFILFTCGLFVVSDSFAAGSSVIPRPDMNESTRSKLPQYLPVEPTEGLLLPPVPRGGFLPASTSGPGFELKEVVFAGNTIFGDSELEAIAAEYIGRRITLSELEQLRFTLTRLYTDKGYYNSGAQIRQGQSVDDGIVIFDIIEGTLVEIRISGNLRLDEDYIRHRIWPDERQVFNTFKLQEQFQWLLQDSLIEDVQGEFLPGVETGTSVLDLKITRARPYGLEVVFDNNHSPVSGAERVQLNGTVRNLLGHGDTLELGIGKGKGVIAGYVSFATPLNQQDTRVGFRFEKSQSEVIEKPLSNLHIENDFRSVEFRISHPWWQDVNGHLLLGLTLSLRENQSYQDGNPFPFSLSDEADGSSQVTALRFWQDYRLRKPEWVVAARSTLSVGFDGFGSTIHPGDIPDSRFVAWLGQLQTAHRLNEDTQLVLRSILQLSSEALMPLERFSLGGMNSVRGYRKNTLVSDQALLLSAELRYSWIKESRFGRFDLIPFVDYARGWNRDGSDTSDELLGVGIGLNWILNKRANAMIYIAHDVIRSGQTDGDLQDSGIFFRLTIDIL